MLFQSAYHEGLRDGSIDRTFRAWARPQVKVGGRYRFGGRGDALEVDAVEEITVGSVTDAQARRAGFADRAALLAQLRRGARRVDARTKVFRVLFHYAGRSHDRPATDSELSADEIDELVARLAGMDRRSQHGPWTARTLGLIADHPRRRAAELAPRARRELRAFKADVRKLKNLGLTISHEVGYEVSPRGRKVLRRLREGN